MYSIIWKDTSDPAIVILKLGWFDQGLGSALNLRFNVINRLQKDAIEDCVVEQGRPSGCCLMLVEAVQESLLMLKEVQSDLFPYSVDVFCQVLLTHFKLLD